MNAQFKGINIRNAIQLGGGPARGLFTGRRDTHFLRVELRTTLAGSWLVTSISWTSSRRVLNIVLRTLSR